MLILTRRPGDPHQSMIRIGDDIIIEILAVRGATVQVGIAAPRDVSVHRQEVYERIRQETVKPLSE